MEDTKIEQTAGIKHYAQAVNLLREAFPADSMVEGRLIKHEELAAVINVEQQSDRYYSMVNAWMQHELETRGAWIVWNPGDGVKVLPPGESLEWQENRTRQKVKQCGRSIERYRYIDYNRLDDTGKARYDHIRAGLAKLNTALEAASRDMAVNLSPVQSLPRRPLLTKGANGE